MVPTGVNVLERVERDAPHHVRGVVAKVARRVAMGRLVHGDGKQHRQGVDQNGLDEIGGVHAGIVSDAPLSPALPG